VNLHALDFRHLAMLGQHPQFFQHFIELLFIRIANNSCDSILP